MDDVEVPSVGCVSLTLGTRYRQIPNTKGHGSVSGQKNLIGTSLVITTWSMLSRTAVK